MFHCDKSLQPVLQHNHLYDSARLWDFCARQLQFSPAHGEQAKKTGEITLPDNTSIRLRVYISQNQLQRKGWLFQKAPRLRAHYQNFLLCEARNISTRKVLCYAEDRLAAQDSWRSLMLVQLSDNFAGAQTLHKQWPGLTLEQRKPYLQAFADQINQLHQSRLSHHNLHPVNLLVDQASHKTCLDQIEHLGYQWRSVPASVQDLSTFLAGMSFIDTADTEFFLQQYWRDCKLGLTYQGLRQRVLALGDKQ